MLHLVLLPSRRSKIIVYVKGMNEDAKFRKCTDTRGRAIRGLWTRRGLYYAQLQLPGKGCRRVVLMDEEKRHVTTVPQAVIARAALLAGKSKGHLPGPLITPLFRDYALKYITFLQSTSAKSPLTIKKERCCLNNLIKALGDIRLNQITRAQLHDYAVIRAEQDEVSNRAINLDIIALRHLLNHAKSEGVLRNGLPTDDWKDLKYVAPKRTLIADDAIDRLCTEATATVKDDEGKSWPKYDTGVFLADYIKLLAYSGARRMAGLRARWEDVDWGNRQLTLHTKFDKAVVVDFNEKLEAHLKDLFERRSEKKKPLDFPITATRGGRRLLREPA